MISSENDKQVTEGVTLRIDESLINELRKESEQKQISFNTLANQIFRQHADWSRNAGKANLVSFPKTLLILLMDKLSNDGAIKLGKRIAKEDVESIILQIKKYFTPESFLSVVELWAQSSNLPYNYTVNGTTHNFIIQHDMGEKWSLYLVTVFESTFEQLISKKIESDITKNTVAFKVDI